MLTMNKWRDVKLSKKMRAGEKEMKHCRGG